MEYTIEALVKDDPEIAHHYARGAKRWVAILRADPSEASLAMRLRIEQLWFEKNCGGRYLGPEVMAVTGIAHLYSAADGFEDNQETAQRVSAAIQASTCSVEVKELARRAAQIYLDEELGEF